MFTSVMRPYALRFEDLVQSIERCSENVDQLAVCAAQAEQRDMHILLVEIKRRIIGIIPRHNIELSLICQQRTKQLIPGSS
jgi:hypothetical protein